MTVQEFQSENPVEIAKRYAEYSGISFDEELESMFKETMAMVADDSRND